jgi:hypothetical protein
LPFRREHGARLPAVQEGHIAAERHNLEPHLTAPVLPRAVQLAAPGDDLGRVSTTTKL